MKNATECNTTMNAVMTGLIITNDMFCAGYDSGGHDACQVFYNLKAVIILNCEKTIIVYCVLKKHII